MQEIYVQSCNDQADQGRTRAFVLVEGVQGTSFSLFEYSIPRNPGIPMHIGTIEFSQRTRRDNYQEAQACIRGIAGADAVLFNPDTDLLPRPLELAVGNHVSLS